MPTDFLQIPRFRSAFPRAPSITRSPPSTFSSRSSGDKFPLTRFHLTARHQTRVSCRAEFPFRRCPSTKSVLRYAANARLAGVPSG